MKRILGTAEIFLLFFNALSGRSAFCIQGWHEPLDEYTDPYITAVYDIDKYVDLYRNGRKNICSFRCFLEASDMIPADELTSGRQSTF